MRSLLLSCVVLAAFLSCHGLDHSRRASTKRELLEQVEEAYYKGKASKTNDVVAGVDTDEPDKNELSPRVVRQLNDQQTLIDAWYAVGVNDAGSQLPRKIRLPTERSHDDDVDDVARLYDVSDSSDSSDSGGSNDKWWNGGKKKQEDDDLPPTCTISCDHLYGLSTNLDANLELVLFHKDGRRAFSVGCLTDVEDDEPLAADDGNAMSIHPGTGEIYVTRSSTYGIGSLYVVDPCTGRAKRLHDGATVDFSDEIEDTSFSVDGTLYALTGSGDLLRFDKLEPPEFTHLTAQTGFDFNSCDYEGLAFDIADQLYFACANSLGRIDLLGNADANFDFKLEAHEVPVGVFGLRGLAFDSSNRLRSTTESPRQTREQIAYGAGSTFHEISTTSPWSKKLAMSTVPNVQSIDARRFGCGSDIKPAKAIVRCLDSVSDFKRKLFLAFWHGCAGEPLGVEAGHDEIADKKHSILKPKDSLVLEKLQAELEAEYVRGQSC